MKDDKVFLKEVGSRIRQKRIEMNMSQEELALIIGYKTRASVSLIESGGRDITRERLVLIANALECSPRFLLGDTEREASKKTPAEEVYDYLIRSGFIEEGEDLTESDLRFLEAQLSSIAAWFKNKKA